MGAERPGPNERERRIGYKAHLQLIGQDGLSSAEIKTPGLEIRTINIASIIPIMDYAFGRKDWDSRSDKYWKDQEWQFQHPDQKQKSGWSDEVKKTYFYLRSILEWTSDSQTRGHLDPAPGIPVYNKVGEIIDHRSPNFENKDDVDRAVAELATYYFNKGKPHKIKPLLAVNISPSGREDLTGVLTLRWKGDPYVPTGHDIASIERLIVAPKKRVKGVGTKLAATAIEYAFNIHKGYGKEPENKGAEEIRTWIMTDRLAGDYSININFFFHLGFKFLRSPYGHWSEYAKLINEKSDREAIWLSLKKEEWDAKKQDNLRIEPYDIIGANNVRKSLV